MSLFFGARAWRSLLDQLFLVQRKRRRQQQSLRYRPQLHELEQRICPSAYDYSVVAQTGSTVNVPNSTTAAGTLTDLAQASINDSGNVGFLGTLNSGYSGVDEGTFNADGSVNLSVLSFTTRNFSFPQIDNQGDVIAQDQYLTGATLNTYIRTWQTNGTFGSGLDAQGSLDGLSGDGDIVIHPAISPDGTQVAYQNTSSGVLSLYINGGEVTSFPSGSAGLYEQIADNGAVVVQDGSSSTSPIMVFQAGASPVTIASTTDFSALGSMPGISADGQVVVFYGDLANPTSINRSQPSFTPLTAGPGIFASIQTATHGRVLIRVAGTGGTGIADVATFDPDDHVAVNSIQPNDPSVTVVFMGQDATGNDGIYVNLVNFFGTPTDPTGFRANVDTLVAQEGDTITGVAGNIQTLNIDDAINSTGHVAFCVTTAQGASAVATADPVPVLAVTPLSQGNSAWASLPYAGGGINPNTGNMYTIGNNGCALTSLTMALNYAGAPSITYIGQSGFTPATLNLLLEAQGGYAGHSVNWSTATDDITAEAGGVLDLVFNYNVSSSPLFLTYLLQTYHEPVIVGVNLNGNGSPTHFVLVTGMVGNQFTIDDPGHSANTTLDDYDNEFQTRGYISDPPDVSDLSFVAVGASPGVNLLATDPSQRQTGTDPATGSTYGTIPQSVTFTDALEDAVGSSTAAETATFVAIFQPQAGAYTLTAGGGTAEPYTIYASPIATDGTLLNQTTFSGTATPGSVSTFSLAYNPQPPVSLSQSSVAVSPGMIAGGSTATVTLTAKDAIGNQEVSGGLTVSFGLGTGTGSGTFGPVKDNGNGTYTATFTGTTAGSNAVTATIGGQAVTSTAPTVTVAISPVVTTNPTSQVASAGNLASFVAAAVGSPAPTVQWQVSTDGGSTFTNVAGATSNTLTFTPTSAQNYNEYRAVFTNESGSATTSEATLTVTTTPSGLVISATAGVFPEFNLVNPQLVGPLNGAPDYFGAQIVPLSTGNVVVTDPSGTGAVYLFNGQTGALISALMGTGGANVTALTNGNFVVLSLDWNGGDGAVTLGNGTTGINGAISATNSLVDISVGGANDITVTPLTNGNYVVANPSWHDNLGLVTWGNGTTGTTGTVSAANSLVGSTQGDAVGLSDGYNSVIALTNGNYVVTSQSWNGQRGAVTWGSGTVGITGTISAANSLVGSKAGDRVGDTGVTALTNGNYVVDDYSWTGGGSEDIGAATWGNGTTGVTGPITAGNSLVGSPGFDVGNSIVALTNGNYVVVSPYWNAQAGAVTWGNGTTGVSGTVTAANSLVGANHDEVGGIKQNGVNVGDVTALANGDYVVASPYWNIDEGAVTWGSGTTGTTGAVSASNSLVGSRGASYNYSGDQVGYSGVTALTNGNYVVDSPYWSGGAGAATLENGTAAASGVISATNSLIGTIPQDLVGGRSVDIYGDLQGDIIALTNGNYVVISPAWGYGAGAATWGNGTTGTDGTISETNSLMGSSPQDQVGSYGVTALTNGNYVVLSPSSGLGGAATWGNGTTGVDGTVSAANSLANFPNLNTSNGAFYVTAFPDGDFLVVNDPGTNVTNGIPQFQTTWENGTTGTTLDGQNTPDAQNSLLGIGGIPIDSGNAFVEGNPGAGGPVITLTDPNLLTYALGQGQTIAVTPDFLTSTLDAGTNVTLQANDDITIDSPITETPSASAGSLTLQAGRSILLNASVSTAGGNLTLIANDTAADGVVSSLRDPGTAAITVASGATLNTGGGTLTTDLKNSTVVTVAPANLAAGSIGVSYVQQLTASGGTAPYTFTLSGGALPGGLSLSSDGLISGTPTAGGSFSFTVQATDAASNIGTQNYTLTAATIGLSPTTLPAATIGAAYDQTVTGSGGTAPYTFTITAGALPTGLSLSSGGTLSGTPTADGSFTFTIQAKDSSTGSGAYTASQQYTLTVNPAVFDYDPSTQTLTIAANAATNVFSFSQATTENASGTLNTTYNFTLNGVTQTYTNSQVVAVFVDGVASSINTAILITNSTYVDNNGVTQGTKETISLGSLTNAGAGTMVKYDASGTPFTFLTLINFPISYAYVGRDDGTVSLYGTAGVAYNGFVSAGNYSYIGGLGLYHEAQGATSVYGYSAGQSTDFAYQYSGNTGSAFVVSGVAFSYMSCTDQNPDANNATQPYFNVGVGFLVNTGVSKNPGQDYAYIIDSPGNDTFVGGNAYSYMYIQNGGGGYAELDTAYAFALVYAESFVGGTDTAINGDPNKNILGGNWNLQ